MGEFWQGLGSRSRDGELSGMKVKRQKYSGGVLFHIDRQPNNSQFSGEDKTFQPAKFSDVKTVGKNKPSLVKETIMKFL